MSLPHHVCTFLFLSMFLVVSSVSAQSDIACISIDAPVSNTFDCVSLLGNAESVAASIRNEGQSAIATGTILQFDVSYGGSLAFTEFHALSADLSVAAVLQVAFSGTLDVSAVTTHTVAITCTAPGDTNPANDTANISFTNPGGQTRSVGYAEDFDSLPSNNGAFAPTIFDVPSGWENDSMDGASLGGNTIAEWAPNDGATGSNQGPLNDHTSGGGNYMYVEDSQSQPGDIRLLSPCLDLGSATGSPLLSFYHVSRPVAGAVDDNILDVDIQDEDSGSTVTLSLLSLPGNGSSDWVRQSLDLSAFAPNRIKVVFRTNNDNGTFTDDVAIDDFMLMDHVPSNGQPPQPGLAVLDMPGAVTSIGESVGSGVSGPYFANVSSTGSLIMSWEGTANAPVACLFGNLNTQSASYPGGIGQTDIGGPGVDSNGFPLNIGALGDGFAYLNVPSAAGHNLFFFTDPAGTGGVSIVLPNLGLAPGSVLTTFQALIADAQAPYFRLSNAIEVTVQ